MIPTTHSRRWFLRSTAAATGTALLGRPPTLAAEPTPPWSMRLSCSSIAFSSLPIEQAVERIARLGFEAIDIWSGYQGCPHMDEAKDRLGPDGLKRLLADHGLDSYAFSVYIGGFPKYAELIGGAGGGVAIRGSGAITDPENITASMKRFLEGLKPQLELAERHNVQLAIENHSGRSLLNYMDSLKAFVDLNDHPRAGIALAPYHIQKNGESVEEAIRVCGDQLLFFYAWQHFPSEKQLPGIGPTDFTPWLKALADVRFRYPVNPFMHDEPAPDRMEALLAKSQAYLKRCYAKAVTS